MKSFLVRWLPALGLMLIIFILSAQPKDNIPEIGIWDLLVKKGGHFIGYALLGAAMLRGICGNESPGGKQLGWAFVLTTLYALTDEYHQTFVPGRGGNLGDVGVDALGAITGLALQQRRLRTRRPVPAIPSPNKSESSRR